MDNTGLNQTQNIGGTDTPQSAATNIGASDATPFQQSASAEALKQNKEIQVVSNGDPIPSVAAATGMSSTAILFIVVSSVVLVMIASSVFHWIMKRPEPVKVEKPKKTESNSPLESYTTKVGHLKKTKKKKVPRSKRNK